MNEKKVLAEGYHWLEHPTQGTIIIKVMNGVIYQIGTVAIRMADDIAFNKMNHAMTTPHNFEYTNEHGWF